ncbi:hypothetical protein [Phytohalomonas tamaricis]|uniref:hypothetical protein n=1 Tax=Phytohalomonas tamaricis TaxID=2081032 RepID=UPI000D0BD5FE|nr:hypothetical protein [Phytohalomonas tamaricis]
MKSKTFQLALGLGLGILVLSQDAMADKSAALKRAEQAADQVDVSDYIDRESDGLSRSMYLGREPVSHDFEVDKPGDYLISARGFRGESGAYTLDAVLKDAQGHTLARASGDQQSGGAQIEHELAPGKYSVVITGQNHSPVREGNRTITVSVDNADHPGNSGLADANRVQRLAPEGSAALTSNKDTSVSATTPGIGSSQRSASVTTSPASAPPKPGPSGQALEQAAAGSAVNPDHQRVTDEARPEVETPAQSSIVKEIPIRENGEVLTFDVVQAGKVSVKSSTFGADAGSYRLAAEIRDAKGGVIARDAGQGLKGDFAIEQQLAPGRYTVYVRGQKYGSAQSGVNSFTLRVEQLN